MIDEIHVQNLALIRDATLMPSRGLTVLTGETGAGKTALLSACKLLCGERADASSVREGTDALLVEGRLFVEGETEGSVVARRVGADGRSRVSIDGAMASVGELQTRVGSTVDLCGQHEHQRLMKAGSHRAMLDAWAEDEIGDAFSSYRAAFAAAEEAAQELQRIQEAGRSSSAKLEEARFIMQRFDAVNPYEGEYEELTAALSLSEHAESLATSAGAAHAALSEEGGALDGLYSAVAALDAMAGVDSRLGDLANSLRDAAFVLEDVSSEARSYRDGIDYDPETLAANQERMAGMQGLMRSYGPRMGDVFSRYNEAAELVSLADDSVEREKRAQAELDQAEAVLAEAADVLDAAHAAAAPLFSQAVSAQMARLEMAGSELVCQIERMERGSWTKNGPSRVEFLFRPAEGMSARPLARIASGGEISRVMLAIKVVLGESDDVATLIFDEVDAGVGGAAAAALAGVLADLAKTHQVIVVTHLAQVAVVGEVHYRVDKRDESGDGLPETVLTAVAGSERVREVARMLSGDATKASLKHAEEMLGKAHG